MKDTDFAVVPDNWDITEPPGALPFRSESCSSHHFLLACYRHWCERMGEPLRLHRKQWEFVYILQSLWERGYLKEGSRGLGFGVGKEPLPATMASFGCQVTATDLAPDVQSGSDSVEMGQNAAMRDELNKRKICDPERFATLVDFQHVDMKAIPVTLRDFDFCWSACSLEQLGSLRAGLDFYRNSLDTLRPGGLAVHTTELNLSSNVITSSKSGIVFYRSRDLHQLIVDLEDEGHFCEPLLIHVGSAPLDNFVDTPPYKRAPHLRRLFAGLVTTSVGIITRKRD